MKIQQQLANRLYELLPHKKELEFGCEMRDKVGLRCVYIGGDYSLVFYPKSIGITTGYNDKDFKIIGQPLRLADLLLAIGKLSKPLPELQLCNIQLDISKRGSNGRDNCLYNLQDDNILDQSDELCEFVLDLLKETKL